MVLKADLQKAHDAMKKELFARRNLGNQFANVVYNYTQNGQLLSLGKDGTQVMREILRKWDALRRYDQEEERD